jgi:hypothetical protein
MPNVFQNTSVVARDAAIELHGALRAAGAMPGKHEAQFAQKVGQTINVKVRPVMSANRHTGSGAFSNSDITEGVVSVAIQHRSYVKHRLTAQERTFSIDDFALQVTRPAMLAIAQDVDLFLTHNVLAPGFARFLVGTDGSEASTLAHLAAAWQKLFDNKATNGKVTGLLTSATAANFLQLTQFISKDYGDSRPSALANAMFSPVYNMDLYPVNAAGSLDRGNVAGTVLVNDSTNAIAVGDATIAVDGFTAATGTVKAGSRFTLAGDTTVYTVIADAAIAGNAATLSIYPALAADPGDGAVATFKAAAKENIVFNPDATARVLIAPEPQLGNPSSVGSFEGISIRTTFESSINDATSGDAEYVLYDVFVGGKVLIPEGGVLMQG